MSSSSVASSHWLVVSPTSGPVVAERAVVEERGAQRSVTVEGAAERVGSWTTITEAEPKSSVNCCQGWLGPALAN